MSAACPPGQSSDTDRTAFGVCMDSVRTLDPTRPVPSRDRPEEGGGLSKSVGSPPPKALSKRSPLQREVWQLLVGGVHSIADNDHGRPWPHPNRAAIARALSEYDGDLCLKAAREAREIVQSQDRAPNITGLFEKKLRDLAEVRSTVRESLGAAA